jgi:hypothetical protein
MMAEIPPKCGLVHTGTDHSANGRKVRTPESMPVSMMTNPSFGYRVFRSEPVNVVVQ